MIRTLFGLLALCPAGPDRDKAAERIIRDAANKMAEMSYWSAAVTMDRTGCYFGEQQMVRRVGYVRARAPYNFEASLFGLSDQPEEGLTLSRIFRPKGLDLPGPWGKISSRGDKLYVTHVGGREAEYRLTPKNLQSFTRDLPPLFLWLDRPKLLSYLKGDFDVLLDGEEVVRGQPCRIVKITGHDTSINGAWPSLRLFVNADSRIARTEFSLSGYQCIVTLSSLRVGDSVGP